MFKSSIKPAWVAAAVLLVALVAAIRFAMAITAFTPANQPIGFVAQDELTNFNLKSGHEILFRGQYEREFWGGDLIAYVVNSEGDIDQATLPWEGTGAAHQIDQQGSDRRIVTLHTDGTKIPFVWNSLSATQQSNLGSSPILDYLRGVRSGEVQQGGTLRRRDSALGGIIHSRPYYVSDGFNPGVVEADTRPTVFVGANDGMLHAFDVRTGRERWAYVPSMLIPKMKNLSVTPYVPDYYVDGAINVATILTGSKRVLVGALGAGGKGLYALDITGRARLTPTDEAAAAANILWEITPTTINNAANAAYANLGYTYANPSIARMLVAGTSTDVVVVGNGYNDGGDFQAYLYVINANTGALVAAIKAGTTGTAASPNGLWTPSLIDSNGDGNVDTVYAGDLNGTMWKFILTGTPSANVLLTTSPAQPITMTPGVALHPSGGYMVNFATGVMLKPGDATDTTTTFAAYGVWDGAPGTNTDLVAQTLTERCYTPGVSAADTPCANRVFTVTANAPDYTPFVSGIAHHKGWRVPLPIGHKVVGDGSFIENGRFYFTMHNPNAANTVQTTVVKGENWLMELDYLSGGTKNLPFLDLSGNHVIDNDDRVKDASTPPAVVSTTDGVPVGKFVAIGVLSQPILVQLSTLNNTLFNQNPDITIVPVVLAAGTGVSGGHFDQDIYFGSISGGGQAVATITVGNTGQVSGVPATLGAITVGTTTIVPALTVVDLPNGTAPSTNAATIVSRITNGFSATVVGNVITLKAPLGAEFNGQAITVGAGSAQTPQIAATAGTPGVKASGTVTFTFASGNTRKNVTALTIVAKGETLFSGAPGNVKAKDLDDSLDGLSSANYTITRNSPDDHSIRITAKNTGLVYNGPITVTMSTDGALPGFTNTALTGGTNDLVAPTPATGWTNLTPAVTVTAFDSSGSNPGTVGDSCTSLCRAFKHFHQYDDTYDVTGVDMLNASSTTMNLAQAIPSLSLGFKVIVQNQYLNPAAKLNIGNPGYLFNVDFGYIRLKDYTTSATLSLADLQTYQRNPAAVWPGSAVTAAEKLAQPKPIGSLVMNLPVDALTNKNWWGNGDVRAGVHPTVTGCVNRAAGATDGNMYQPVIPPANGDDGPGSNGYSGTTTPDTATGVRHNGALVIQIIRANTPNSAIEQSVPGRPEYGWRVKSSLYSTHVLAEYSTFWHHPNGKCYSTAGWTKAPGPDTATRIASAKAPGSTDPKLGDLGVGGVGGVTADGSITSVTTTVTGQVTTTIILYADNTTARIVRTASNDGSVSIVTTDKDRNVSTQNIASAAGSLRSGGDERGLQARVGRISWRELVAP